MLQRIIYTSLAVGVIGDEELSSLCQASTIRNIRDEVTGLFLFDGIRFLQAIEGEVSVVERLMARINADTRHADIVYIQREAVSFREFPHWSMEEPLDHGIDPRRFVEQVKSDVALVRCGRMRAQFIEFARVVAAVRASILDRPACDGSPPRDDQG